MTTLTHDKFIMMPLQGKPVTVIPGIGRVLGGTLIERDGTMANQVYGQFLVYNQDEGRFKTWLRDTCGANAGQQKACYDAMNGWYNNHC